MPELTTIPIRKETRNVLKKCGFKDETYDDVIIRLIKASEMLLFHRRQKEIIENERFVSLDKI